MAYLSVPKISRHLIFLHLSSPFIVDNCSYISILSFAITYCEFCQLLIHLRYYTQKAEPSPSLESSSAFIL